MPGQKPKARFGCVVKALFTLLGILLAGSLALFLFSRPFVDRTRRADAFGHYIKTGLTIQEVFSGPREWNHCWIGCVAGDKEPTTIMIFSREGHFEVGNGATNITKIYPNIDALLQDLGPGIGPFTGRKTISFSYKFYMVSRTYVLTIGADGRVEKIDIISRS
jgi:hypothetical protein